ncbi:poly(A) polymerase/tRNA-nucleotidyltransferase [Allostella vacuolata]|nr:poly(A) polymerase/tRNA-nucleotidyltransferase [Stella vacuolata]
MEARGCLLPQPWMTASATRRVMAAVAGGGGRARFVGGMVRDALLGRPISDIDLATDLDPERVMGRLVADGIRVIPTGLAHGTVTAVVGGRHFEITTLRRDVETDGRHARIAYTDDWAEDARRRDFTINALFADGDGTFYDPAGGLDDLVLRRVRFVGDPDQRIHEDVLRLLRYYRMLARLGIHGLDAPSRAACRRHAGRLPALSGERVRGEVERILSVADPRPVLAMIVDDGILPPILPMATAFARAARLIALEPAADWLRRLAALVEGGEPAAVDAARRLRLSRQETGRLVAMAGPWTPADLPQGGRALRDRLHALGAEPLRDRALLAAAAGLDRDGTVRDIVAAAAVTERPVFPLKGRDLVGLGLARGPQMAQALATVAAWWAAGDYAADREACLAQARALLASG